MRNRVGASVLLLLAAELGSAENLIYNHEFDAGLVGWVPDSYPSSTSEIVDDDASGNPSSAALSLTVAATLNTGFEAQCTEGVFGGIAYDFGVRIHVAADQVGTGLAAVVLDWFPNTFCLGEGMGGTLNSPLVGGEEAGFWTPSYSSGIAPEGALSALVYVLAQRNAGDSFAAWFDGVIMAEQGTEPLPLFIDGFERENTSAWHQTLPE